ncbi:hypothetical protein [Streptomyces sp. NPDC005970]|uniref:hypothetical protein n=1 Tax=Streptomyces sp. NPDC005970 TaxID=3156723 RepID=UPI0033EA6F7C
MGALTVLWLVVLGACGALETVAWVADRRGSSLSARMWEWFASTDRRRAVWTRARHVASLVAMTWLAVRFNTAGQI